MKRALFILLAASAMALVSAETASRAASDPDPWLCLGPFPNPEANGVCVGFDRDYLEDSGGEAAARPREGSPCGGAVWRRAPSDEAGDSEYLDFLRIFENVEYKVAYLHREFDAGKGGAWALRLGSDDGLKLWVNGKQVYANHIHRALSPGEDLVVVDMKSGINRLLFKVDQGNGGWAFTFSALPAAAMAGRASTPRSLTLATSTWLVEAGGSILCGPATRPPALVDAPVIVELSDQDGQVIASASTLPSRPVTVKAPPGSSGVHFLRARGKGKLAGLSSARIPVVIGSLDAAFSGAISEARRGGASSPRFDAGASLEFLGNLIEGRTDPSLCPIERRLRGISALRDVKSALLGKGMPAGTYRLAFRSALDGSVQPYSLRVPEDVPEDAPGGPAAGKEKKRPLLVMLHGKGGDDAGAIAPFADARDREFLVLAPFGRGDFGYANSGEADVLEAMAEVMSRFRVDSDRVYVAGSSMGGFGALRLAQLYADRFAAVASFAGWPGAGLLGNLHSLPVLLVHGDADDNVPVQASRNAAAVLKDSGSPVRIDILPGVGHSAFEAWAVGGGDRLLDYLRPFKRDPWPARISLSVSRPRYGKHYWAEAIGMEAGVRGSIDASVDDERHVSVETSGINSFALDLRHPRLASVGRIVVWLDGRTIAVDAGGERVGFRKDGGGSFVRSPVPDRAAINEGGGLLDLFVRPLYVVYGSGGGKANADLRRTAERFADLGADERVAAGARSGKTRVVSDREYDAMAPDGALARASAVFIGNAAQNSSLKALASRSLSSFPLSWSRKGISFRGGKPGRGGFWLVLPYPGRTGALMAVIDAPFKKDLRESFIRSITAEARIFAGFEDDPSGPVLPDFLFCGPGGNVVTSGSYDAEWKEYRPFGP
jgi:predicted esterase